MKEFAVRMLLIMALSAGYLDLSSQTAAEYSDRRMQVIRQMVPGSVMILKTVSPSGRFDYEKQGGYFYYLTGIDEPDCYLILFSSDLKLPGLTTAGTGQILFIRPVNRERMNWDAQTIGIEGAREKYGFTDVRPASEAFDFTGKLLSARISVLYAEIQKSGSVVEPLTGDEQMILKAREHGATFGVESPAGILAPMLSRKSPSETALVRKAVDITAKAQNVAMRSIREGLYEYQIDALIRYVFSVNGSGGVSFPTIVGSGINSVILHWMENSRRMEDGDMVVVDCGTEYQMYCADITRTYPVSGKFTRRQKEIYEIVLAANEAAIKKVGPGVSMTEVNAAADSVIAAGLLRIGLIKDKSEFKKYYYHGLSHQIGLKGAFGGLVEVLQPGMVITIEPGIYVREEKIGVRIEDDVLVTDSGYDVLSRNAPKKVADIEKAMKEEGVDVTRFIVR